MPIQSCSGTRNSETTALRRAPFPTVAAARWMWRQRSGHFSCLIESAVVSFSAVSSQRSLVARTTMTSWKLQSRHATAETCASIRVSLQSGKTIQTVLLVEDTACESCSRLVNSVLTTVRARNVGIRLRNVTTASTTIEKNNGTLSIVASMNLSRAHDEANIMNHFPQEGQCQPVERASYVTLLHTIAPGLGNHVGAKAQQPAIFPPPSITGGAIWILILSDDVIEDGVALAIS